MNRAHSFAVVLFGSRPRLLPATRSFRSATKKNVREAVAALYSIQPGLKSPLKPNGTLYGATNLYGAFHTAFRVGPRGLLETSAPDVDPRLFGGGPDTIFFLSDGMPTEDDFEGYRPPRERTVRSGGSRGDGVTRDPETGATIGTPRPQVKRPRGPPRKVIKSKKDDTGPYVERRPLLEEIERLNLIRKVVIHVVSIGEAGEELPRSLAEQGRGQFVHIGD